jgi:two-component system response regulator DegU
MKAKILIVDDHPYTRNGIKAIIEASNKFMIAGEAVDGNDAVIKVKEKQPDIVIMDINMPGLSGVEATKRILSENNHVKIIAFSIFSEGYFVKEMLNAGATGYILKDNAPDELLRAIDNVIKGRMFLSSNVTQAALKKENHLVLLQTKLHRPPVMDDKR